MRVSVLLILMPAALAAYGGIVYYRLAWLHLQGRQALRHIDEQLKNHHERIPHLLLAVADYLHHERDVLEHVLQARRRSLAASTIEDRLRASGHLSHALDRLFQASEMCPGLHSNDEAALIQMQVRLAEQKIALARDYYNQVIEHYNRRLESFPGSLMAKLGGYRRMAVFEFPEHLSREYASAEF